MSQKSKKTVEKWLNENSILQDLSAVQGRVPVALDGTAVGAGDKPPALNIKEETEEEFFPHCLADGDIPDAPDLMMIKQMLDMVRDVNLNSDDDHSSDKHVVISKLNASPAQYKPNARNTSSPIAHQSSSKEEKKKKKRQRNLAIEAILQAIADKNNNDSTEQEPATEVTPLRKPQDFLSTNTKNFQNGETINETSDHSKVDMTVPTAIEKVNGWIETQTESPFPKKTSKVVLDSSSFMFKKKSVVKTQNLQKSNNSLSSYGNEYIPSGMANEYYEKFLEQNKFKETVKDNLYLLWSRIEGKMKEFNEKRHMEAENSHQSFEETQITDTDEYKARIVAEMKVTRCMDAISLSQHRHKLTGPCVVCQALSLKYRATNEQEIQNTRKIAQEKESALKKCPYVIEDDNSAIVREENIPESFRLIEQKRLENELKTEEVETTNVDIVNDLVKLNDSKEDINIGNVGKDPKEGDFVQLIDLCNDPEVLENNISKGNNCSTFVETKYNNVNVENENLTEQFVVNNELITKNVENVDFMSSNNVKNEDFTSKNLSLEDNIFYENLNSSTTLVEDKEDGVFKDCIDYLEFKNMADTDLTHV